MATRPRSRSAKTKSSTTSPTSSVKISNGGTATAMGPGVSSASDASDMTRTVAAPGIASATLAAIDESTSQPGDSVQVRFVGEQFIYLSREERIAETAYGYAQERAFAPGNEVADWLRAEKEVDSLLAGAHTPA